jgi:uncharacterized protein YqgC (DUF456 family)
MRSFQHQDQFFLDIRSISIEGQRSKYLKNLVSEHPNIPVSEYPNIRVSEYPIQQYTKNHNLAQTVTMDIVLLIIIGILGLAGLLFSIFPPLPGPLLPLGGLFILHFAHSGHLLSLKLVLIMTVLTILVMIIENVVPIWGTMKMGGSKAGIWGSTIGLIAGLFLLTPFFAFAGPFAPILAIIVGPFVGAVIGELVAGKDSRTAMRAAMGSFFGFVAGTGLKLMICCVMIWQTWAAVIKA